MGIRPEHINDARLDVTENPNKITAKIRVYELLGAEVFLYFDFAGSQMTARVDPKTTAKMGDDVEFSFDMNMVHFFDKDSEETITN